MLTNEQRAHDLAITMLKFTLDNPSTISSAGEEGARFNVATEYSKLYRAFLEAMEQEFPPQDLDT